MDSGYLTQWTQIGAGGGGSARALRQKLRSLTLSVLAHVSPVASGGSLKCFFCHNVFSDQTARFEQILVELMRHGKFVDTDTCVAMLEGQKKIDGRYYHLSFDDGFRNNFLNAYPILKKHAVPCIFFVPSDIIGADWEKTKTFCLEKTNYGGVIEMMNWDDLKRMLSEGYEIGSHTKTHARFSEVSSDIKLMRNEITGSKKQLESRLGVECKYISWPYGRRCDANDPSLKAVAEAGYRACFGAFRGSVIPQQTPLFKIPRHHFEVDWPLSHIRYFAEGAWQIRR